MSPNDLRSPQHRGPRLFVEGISDFKASDTFPLSSDASHYVRDVLRLSLDDWMELGDAKTGGICAARIVTINETVHLTIEEWLRRGSSDTGGPILLFALCKGDKNDIVCDWATELGCSQIVFWQAARSIVRLRGASDVAAKQTRLSKIAVSAAQQSKQDRPPQVMVCPSLAEALTLLPPAQDSLRLACSLDPSAEPLRKRLVESSTPIVLVVGPEGDVSPEEHGLLQTQGFVPVSLGESVLRSELAALTGLVACRLARSFFE